VDLQNLVATAAEFGAMFLQAGQNGEITLIDDLTTVTLDVARTGFLFLSCALALLLGERSTCERQQGKGQEIFAHCSPFLKAERPHLDRAERNTLKILQTANTGGASDGAKQKRR